MAVETVAFSDLDSWLENHSPHNVDNPYELNITGLTINDIGSSSIENSLGYILKKWMGNNKRWVDLRPTSLPNGITNMDESFMRCDALVGSPEIPNTVTSMYKTYLQCSGLKYAPRIIPSSVVSLYGTFDACDALTTAPIIPDSVTDVTI